MNPIDLDDANAVYLRDVAWITHTVRLALDGPVPLVPVPFGKTQMLPYQAQVEISHNRDTGDLYVTEVELTGHRAKADGTAGKLSSSGRWSLHERQGVMVYGYDDHADHPYVLNVIKRAIAIMEGMLR